VGGVSTDGAFFTPSDAVGCPEIYDPKAKAFSLLQDQCGTWGAGAYPATGTWEGIGTVFTKGYTVPTEDQDALGFVGSGPT
jgi:hypothetical protein